MSKPKKVPPFVPAKPAKTRAPRFSSEEEGPMVVLTVRITPKARDKMQSMYRSNLGFKSVSHIIQMAVDKFSAEYP